MLVGVISDTHGLLRAAALAALRGCEHIVHAGDIGSFSIIPALAEIAPVTAIRGNVDEAWAQTLPETEVVAIAGLHIYMLHDLNTLDLDPETAGFAAVVSGHTHQPKQEMRNGVLYFNPGSAGPRRFKLPVSLGFLEIVDGKVSARIVELL